MTVSRVIAALGLPGGTFVDQRVPKTLLVENGAPTTADKKLIKEGIESLTWTAALKPSTVGVPDFRDETREYVEIIVISLQLRSPSKPPRLLELVHRAVPYPVVLLTEGPTGSSISLVHKRWSLGEVAKTVLDGELSIADLDVPFDIGAAFLEALALSKQPRNSLFTVYQGWMNAALALQAAALTGAFLVSESLAVAEARANALRTTKQLESQITAIRAAAAKEKQIAKQVSMNLEMKRLEAQLTAVRAHL